MSYLAALTAPLVACVGADAPTTSTASEDLVGGLELGVFHGTSSGVSEVVDLTFPQADGTTLACTATRIGQRQFLTAAHCLAYLQPDTPVEVRGGSPATLVATLSAHAPLTLTQNGAPFQNDYVTPDVAIITVDARNGGYADLGALEDNVSRVRVGDGHSLRALMTQIPGLKVLHIGYGCNHRAQIDTVTPPGAPPATGADTLRFGTAPLVSWPSTGAPLDPDLYVVTQGQGIVRGPDDSTTADDTLADDGGVSFCPGDSGGPVFAGSDVLAVASRLAYGEPGLTHVLDVSAIPDQAWANQVGAMPVIDVIGASPAELDPTRELPGRTVTIYPDVAGHDALYVKGYALTDLTWTIGGDAIAPAQIEVLPRGPGDDELQLDTVKITFPHGEPAHHGPVIARPDAQSNLSTRSGSVVDVVVQHDQAWRQYGVYRALTCGQQYGSVTASCDALADGLTAMTIVRSTVFETTVAGQPVSLEKIEDTRQAVGYGAAWATNTVPTAPLSTGVYTFATTSCAPDNGACATIYIDFSYRQDQLVEQYGDQCRYRSRRFYDVEPYVWVLDQRLVLTDLMQDVLSRYQVDGLTPGTEASVDEPLAACAATLAAHPSPAPFHLDGDGVIVPEPGWVRR